MKISILLMLALIGRLKHYFTRLKFQFDLPICVCVCVCIQESRIKMSCLYIQPSMSQYVGLKHVIFTNDETTKQLTWSETTYIHGLGVYTFYATSFVNQCARFFAKNIQAASQLTFSIPSPYMLQIVGNAPPHQQLLETICMLQWDSLHMVNCLSHTN